MEPCHCRESWIREVGRSTRKPHSMDFRLSADWGDRYRSRAELPKVVVHVQVGPTKPAGLRHPAENRMRLPVEISRMRRDEIQQRHELGDVRGEIDRPRPSNFLIEFRPCEDSSRPRQRKIKSDPFDHRSLKPPGGVAHRLLP